MLPAEGETFLLLQFSDLLRVFAISWCFCWGHFSGRVRRGSYTSGALFSALSWCLLDHSCHIFVFHLCPVTGFSCCMCWLLRQDVDSISLILRATEYVHCYLTLTLLLSLLELPWSIGCTYGTYLCPYPFLPPLSLRYAYLQILHCKDLSGMFVCWAGKPLLNYSCPTCYNFKGETRRASHIAMLLTSLKPFNIG